LQGLAEEPRCPECGLLNIPEGYRRQVQELVDSGKWFFSSFFGVLRKRPPGWWWSLDRPGDIKRAIKCASLYLTFSFLMIFLASIAGNSVQTEWINEWVDNSRKVDSGPPIEVFQLEGQACSMGVFNSFEEMRTIRRTESMPQGSYPTLTFSTTATLRPPDVITALTIALPLSMAVFSLWFLPASAGILSQIRKGLPAYARPRRTIFSRRCTKLIASSILRLLL
jgi:hypothetical protein